MPLVVIILAIQHGWSWIEDTRHKKKIKHYVFNLVTSGIILAKMEVIGVNIFSKEAGGVQPLWSLYAVQSWQVHEQCCLSDIGEGSMLGPMCFVTTLMDVIVLHKMETEGN